MRTHIDWLTFTMPMIYWGESVDAYEDAISKGFTDMFGKELLADAFGGHWTKNERSRAPYTDSWKLGDNGITLFASRNLNHCCVEISGKGCENLIETSLLANVLSCAKERVTRIDIACDIETTVRPSEFVAQVKHERMRTSGQVISDTGETCYVGSQKSERYARVYRYNEPHPRSHLLRVEHVFRKDYAKKVADAIIADSIEQVAKSSGDAFGWAHTIWRPDDVDGSDISVVKERRGTGGTIFWLISSVAPAFKRMVQEGAIENPEQFLETYFLSL